MKITDEHMEWATVDRLREMLTSVHEDYKVTHTYALFTAILCWVMQRIRTNGNEANDVRARELFDRLRLERPADAPWMLTSDGESPHLSRFEFTGHSAVRSVRDFCIADLLVALRNAVAHGDARRIQPVNQDDWLAGQRFLVKATNDQWQLLWSGQIVLRRPDMKRIGEVLAQRFCRALEQRPAAGPLFVEEARRIQEEAVPA